ncbi:3'(2'),5'-bisphosphate nucleotidase [Bradyrhizobium erythrophlei]|uniref:3'(2'),5'-bisphosphate nucleotidase CysQ n=2 Tax=Bradyrhizobium erythrophlei TaxID=1437360 RepID=A0A1M7U8B7_9BRAD|nr:3'(2'),5'-bisphosphate nucleotidase [Bradyrhizobium erythrophlei]
MKGSPPPRHVSSSPIGDDAAARLMAPLTALVARAGSAILKIDRKRMQVDGKADGSPVTDADLAADRIIADGLKQLAPDIPALSEERARPLGGCPDAFFLIDPLDGTKEFVAGRDEFTVNIALVVKGTPLLGIIGAPALGLIWRGLATEGIGRGAERLAIGQGNNRAQESGPAQAIRTRRFPPAGQAWVAATSRSHADAASEAFIDARPGAVRLKLGSAVKLAKVAEGEVDVYPRLAPTSEWDIAAGHAIVTGAGGKVTDAAGRALRFGKGGDFIVPAFIAWGDPEAS